MECIPHSRLCSECCTHTHIYTGIFILILLKRKLRQGKVKSPKPHDDSVGEPVFELRQSDSRACTLYSLPLHLHLPSSWHSPHVPHPHPPHPSQLRSTFQSPLVRAMPHSLCSLTWRLKSRYCIFSVLNYTISLLFALPSLIHQLVIVLRFSVI